jgi:hypothetical protein
MISVGQTPAFVTEVSHFFTLVCHGYVFLFMHIAATSDIHKKFIMGAAASTQA